MRVPTLIRIMSSMAIQHNPLVFRRSAILSLPTIVFHLPRAPCVSSQRKKNGTTRRVPITPRTNLKDLKRVEALLVTQWIDVAATAVSVNPQQANTANANACTTNACAAQAHSGATPTPADADAAKSTEAKRSSESTPARPTVHGDDESLIGTIGRRAPPVMVDFD
eukprot:1257078-Pleurochrysis_carterae.AAC.1